MSGISTLSRPYKSITHLERSFLLPLAPPREPTSRSLFFFPLIPFFNAANSCEFSTNSRKEAWPLFSNGNLIVSQLFNVARNSNRSSISFQRFSLPRNHGVLLVEAMIVTNSFLAACIQPPLFACPFFYLDGVIYTHTDTRGARGNLCRGPPPSSVPSRPSFQPCFTYRPTPICSNDRGKPKGRLFLTDLTILFSRCLAQTIERIWRYIYMYVYFSNR